MVAQILKKSNQFGLLFSSADTLDSFSYRSCGLNNGDLMISLLSQTHSLDYKIDQVEPALKQKIDFCCERLIENIISEGRAPSLWGWKEPLMMFWLPFMRAHFPDMKFIHIIRDVRSIRKKHFQGSEKLYLEYFADPVECGQRERFEKIWSSLNLDILAWSKKNLPRKYYMQKIEDLTGENRKEAIEDLLCFTGLKRENVDKLAGLAKTLRPFEATPRSGIVAKALEVFGYI